MTNYKGAIEQHISDLELAITNAEDETHKAYWQREKEFLEELKWWREQDLIPRQPLIAFIDNSNIKHREWLIKAISDVRRFPKAEPPHATVDERNGDCETCKHYNTGITQFPCNECSLVSAECYEPYIPKE